MTTMEMPQPQQYPIPKFLQLPDWESLLSQKKVAKHVDKETQHPIPKTRQKRQKSSL